MVTATKVVMPESLAMAEVIAEGRVGYLSPRERCLAAPGGEGGESETEDFSS